MEVCGDESRQLRSKHYALNSFRIVELTRLFSTCLDVAHADGTQGRREEALNDILALLRCMCRTAAYKDACECCSVVAAQLPLGTVLDHDSTGAALDAMGTLFTALAAREAEAAPQLGGGARVDLFPKVLKENQARFHPFQFTFHSELQKASGGYVP